MDEVGLMFFKANKKQAIHDFVCAADATFMNRMYPKTGDRIVAEVSLRDKEMFDYVSSLPYYTTIACQHIRPNHLLLYWRTDE